MEPDFSDFKNGTLANAVIQRSVEARENSVRLGEVPQAKPL